MAVVRQRPDPMKIPQMIRNGRNQATDLAVSNQNSKTLSNVDMDWTAVPAMTWYRSHSKRPVNRIEDKERNKRIVTDCTARSFCSNKRLSRGLSSTWLWFFGEG